jgi:hypothetical protein
VVLTLLGAGAWDA